MQPLQGRMHEALEEWTGPYGVPLGELAEWSMALDSKSSVGQPTRGSNPWLSAISSFASSCGQE